MLCDGKEKGGVSPTVLIGVARTNDRPSEDGKRTDTDRMAQNKNKRLCLQEAEGVFP